MEGEILEEHRSNHNRSYLDDPIYRKRIWIWLERRKIIKKKKGKDFRRIGSLQRIRFGSWKEMPQIPVYDPKALVRKNMMEIYRRDRGKK